MEHPFEPANHSNGVELAVLSEEQRAVFPALIRAGMAKDGFVVVRMGAERLFSSADIDWIGAALSEPGEKGWIVTPYEEEFVYDGVTFNTVMFFVVGSDAYSVWKSFATTLVDYFFGVQVPGFASVAEYFKRAAELEENLETYRTQLTAKYYVYDDQDPLPTIPVQPRIEAASVVVDRYDTRRRFQVVGLTPDGYVGIRLPSAVDGGLFLLSEDDPYLERRSEWAIFPPEVITTEAANDA